MSETESKNDAVVETETTSKVASPATHADMFFRYVAALCGAAGVQAFTMAVAVPKEDGTSSILSVALGPPNGEQAWREEIAKLLGENATKSALSIAAPVEPVVSPVEPAEVV